MHDPELDLHDAIIFELPSSEHLRAFCARLRPRWKGWTVEDKGVWLFAARLGRGSLASLLREAQDLLAELGVAAVGICLDGRAYQLEAARSRETGDLAASSA
jgi:hypothetical protein